MQCTLQDAGSADCLKKAKALKRYVPGKGRKKEMIAQRRSRGSLKSTTSHRAGAIHCLDPF